MFVPIYFATPDKSPIGKALKASAEKINTVRNAVVHQGAFSNPDEAEAVIAEAKTFINTIVGLSIPNFDIEVAAREWQASRETEAGE
ncbi:hypothetical protein [Sphingomonas sp. Ant H11]|uniref:hypothetical protein n=1 Tax=Sphingomonas sp. Ant H11 TaxID=1564113 RepID=UPI001E53A9CF|nr:hypothetical protein [Sphingomonas sp. Ant H11]